MAEDVVATACPAWPFGVDADADEAVSFALTHARSIQAPAIEPLHILLGLLRESCHPVRVALHNLGIDAGGWRARFDTYRRGTATGGSPAVPLSPPAICMMEHAHDHARRREPHRFGSCEMLLGLIDWSPPLFSWLLGSGGIGVAGLRHEVLDLAGSDACQVASELLHAPFAADLALEALSPPAREALDIATQEARGRGASAVGAEHLLLALARPSAGGAAAILEMMGAFPQDVRAKVEARIGSPGTPAASAPGMSPEVEWVLGVAHNEAQRLGQQQVGTEALLMGILWLRRSAAADALAELEITIHRTRIALSSIRDTKRISVPPERRLACTARMQSILARAQRLLRESPSLESGSWHLLVALAEGAGGLGPRVLGSSGIKAPEVLHAARGYSPTPVADATADTRRLLGLTREIAARQGHAHPGSDSLLLALVESETAGAWLRERGVTAEAVQSALAPLSA